jgi:hypothetical protein
VQRNNGDTRADGSSAFRASVGDVPPQSMLYEPIAPLQSLRDFSEKTLILWM